MDAVEYALWLVESRLDEGPTLAGVAREAGLSPFYLTRRFAEETGLTLGAYVRSRRLGEAARALLAGAPNILDVAVAAGYGSHEAFTRAFRAEFGLTPEQVRARGQEQPITIRTPVRMRATRQQPVTPPSVEAFPAGRYVGIVRRYAVGELGRLPGQWEEFQRHLTHIDRAGVAAAYGVVRLVEPAPAAAEQDAAEEVMVEYASVLPESSGLRPRGELTTVSVPALRVARFEHTGHISGIHASTSGAFESLAAAGLRSEGRYELVERYGPEFDPRSGYGPVGLLLPIAAA